MNVEAVKGQSWDDFFVELDKKADYIPVVSTVTNVADLVLKGAITLMDQQRLEEALQSNFFQHIQDKSIARSVALLVPVVGNGIIYLYDRETGKVSDPEVVDAEGELLPPEEAVVILQKASESADGVILVTLYIPPEQVQTVSDQTVSEVNGLVVQAMLIPQVLPPSIPDSQKLPLLKPKLIKAGLRIRI